MNGKIRVGMDIHTIKPMVKQNSSFEYTDIQPTDRFRVLEVADSLFLRECRTIEAVNERKGVFVFDESEVEPYHRNMQKPY